MNPLISVVIATYNEEKNIKLCLENLKDLAGEIIIVDMFSTDRTVEICKKYTKKIYFYKKNCIPEEQHMYGIQKATKPWILIIDADEILTDHYKKALNNIDLKNTEYAGFRVCQKKLFLGKSVVNNEEKTPGSIRFFKKGSHYPSFVPHTPIKIPGKLGEIKEGYFLHNAYPTINQFIKKNNHYSDFEVQSLFEKGKRTNLLKILLKPLSAFLGWYFMHKQYGLGARGLIHSMLQANNIFMQEIKLYWLAQNNKNKAYDKEYIKYIKNI